MNTASRAIPMALAFGLAITACSKKESPAAPTATVSTVAVSGTAPAVGAAVQFTATATLSDGTTQPVTSTATWSSSNTAVATVNSAGVVTGVGAGDADITASYQNVAGRSHVTIGRTTFTLSGNVTDGTSGGVLPGITVQAVDSSGNTQSARSDGGGAYSIGGLAAGTATITATAVSYQPLTQTVSMSANTRLDLVLRRVACAFTLSTTGLSFGSSGGTGTVTITSQATGCAWTAISNDAFLVITSAASGVDNGTVTFSVAANSGSARSGTLTIAGVTLTVTQDGTSIVVAVYDPTFKTPLCNAIGNLCDSGTLLRGRAGGEANNPSTLFNSCPDGSGNGGFATINAIRVSTVDGTPLGPGKSVRIEVDGGGSTADNLRVYVAADAQAPSWTLVSQGALAFGTHTVQTTLPPAAGSGFQAVRATLAFGSGFGPGPCAIGSDDDNDDLVFRVR